ncbi:MAG TPA: MarR family transcriptional regulator [Clostridiales bacterium]|nr:MarR family transcriptional regulator [Clostridiales bacterium]
MKHKAELVAQLLEADRRHRQTKPIPQPLLGLRPNEIGLLYFLSHHLKSAPGGLTVSYISSKLSVTRSAITQLINRLERLGLINRQADSADRRHVRVTLTEKAHGTLKTLQGMLAEQTSGLVEYLGENDTKELIRLLNKISDYYAIIGSHAPETK